MAESTFTYYGGIDFSGARGPLSNLWSAVGEEREGRLCILDLRPHPFREDLAAFVGGCGWLDDRGSETSCLWGLDFPFSIPGEAAAALVGATEVEWEKVADFLAYRPPDDVRDAAEGFHKSTRQVDVGKAMAPLDLRIYKQTVEGVRFLDGLRREVGVSVLPLAPREGARQTVIEVYPSLTATDLNILGRKPSRPGQVRARPEKLAAYLDFDHRSMEATAVAIEDAWDATLACLTAFLVRDDLDQPRRVGTVDERIVAMEGWIYRHPDAAGTR